MNEVEEPVGPGSPKEEQLMSTSYPDSSRARELLTFDDCFTADRWSSVYDKAAHLDVVGHPDPGEALRRSGAGEVEVESALVIGRVLHGTCVLGGDLHAAGAFDADALDAFADAFDRQPGDRYFLPPRLRALGARKDVVDELLALVDARRRAKRRPGGLPTVVVNGKQLRDLADEVLAVIVDANDPPKVFMQGEALSRFLPDDGHELPPRLEPLTGASLKSRLSDIATWQLQVGKDKFKDVNPPGEAVGELLARARLPDIPPANRVARVPVFAPSGELHQHSGYDPRTRAILVPDPAVTVPDVPENPTAQDVAAALHLLCGELFSDFPFVGESEKAHALSLSLTSFVRDFIAGPTPLFVFEAPTPGTGKTLLAKAALAPALGRAVPVMTQTNNEDEWRKRITASLRDGPTAVVIDNVHGPVSSAALAGVLTATTWEDRELGHSRKLYLPVRAVFAMTVNNASLDSELKRRAVRIRLDSGLERPQLRDDWRHQLPEWALANRGRLVWACLVLVRAWLRAGRPEGEMKLGTYEEWSAVLGGILSVAGCEGFLGNLDEFYAEAEDELVDWRPFLGRWRDCHGAEPVGVKELFTIVERDRVGPDLGAGTAHSRHVRLGTALRSMVDRPIGRWKVVKAGERHRAQLYRLLEADTAR